MRRPVAVQANVEDGAARSLPAQRGVAKQRSVAQIVSFVAPAPEPRVTTGLGREVVERLLAESIYAVVNGLVAWW